MVICAVCKMIRFFHDSSIIVCGWCNGGLLYIGGGVVFCCANHSGRWTAAGRPYTVRTQLHNVHPMSDSADLQPVAHLFYPLILQIMPDVLHVVVILEHVH